MYKLDPKRVLLRKPFIAGMATALDIYGAQGLRMYDRIQQHWIAVTSQPRPSAEESIRESIATVNGEYHRLLAEQRD